MKYLRSHLLFNDLFINVFVHRIIERINLKKTSKLQLYIEDILPIYMQRIKLLSIFTILFYKNINITRSKIKKIL